MTQTIIDVLNDVDWDEVHRMRINYRSGRVVVFDDGKLSYLQNCESYRDTSDVLGYLKCWGIANIDLNVYSEGIERAESMSAKEIVEQSINNRDWSEKYQEWIDEILEQAGQK